MTDTPYRLASPKPDPAPSMRWRWSLLRDEFNKPSGAFFWLTWWFLTGFALAAMFVWHGAAPMVLRWAAVQALGLLAWALVFVRAERMS